MIRVVIAEDQKLLRGALISLLSLEDDIEVVAEAENGFSALEEIRRHKPDISLLDIELPGLSGLEVAKTLKQERFSTKIIILTTFGRPGFIRKAMDLKVEGYLLKDEPIDVVVESIRKVAAGERAVSTDLAAALFMMENNPLTEREAEVLKLSRAGLTTKEIAKTLHLTEGTVRNYLSLAIQKLGVETRQQATEEAYERGWI